MNKKRFFALMAATMIACTMLACVKPVPAANYQVIAENTGTINGVEYTISQYNEIMKYQIPMLEKKGFYVDALEEPDSPAIVFISAGKKHGNGVTMNVNSIEVDDDNNVTITVFEAGEDGSFLGKAKYPTVQVTLYPFPASIRVFDADGTELN